MRKITIKFYDHQLNHKTKNLVYISDGDKEILSDGCRTPVNQIKSDKLLRAATESLASPDESNGGSPKTIREWVKVTDELNAVKDNTSEHHYWAEFAHNFFSKALQYFANLNWMILCFKNFGLNHALEKVVDGKFADILAQTWDTKEELFVGEQANAPTNPDLTKYATDWFKLYRELRDCLNLRILQAMKLGDINYNDHLVFGILGYLYEMKMTIMWKDGIYIYEEFGSFTIASHIGMIHQMKAGITKLLEFIEESSKIRHFSFNGDEVQILKRKFQEIITQTQESPPKRPKSKAAC
ncbi:8972_t:CDS:2 [Entrophospora sp. SA101]|nr:8972_t:CDS:2 [Entrophospora sp. SA101]